MLDPILTPELFALPTSEYPDFEWDEWRFQSFFYYALDDERDQLSALTPNANRAFAIAICEWVEHRFSGLSKDKTPLDYICSGWAALINSEYSQYFDYDDQEWQGPVRGPLMAAFGIVNEIFYESGDDPDMAMRTCFALNLARHVMPPESGFEEWFEAVLSRLQTHHLLEEDPHMVPDIFSKNFPTGRAVGRDAFDLERNYYPQGADQRLAKFVTRQASLGNQFIDLPTNP